jgi:hypothetical protein
MRNKLIRKLKAISMGKVSEQKERESEWKGDTRVSVERVNGGKGRG